MTDFFNDDKDDINTSEPTIEITPNIELQLNKFNDGEYLKEKYIPEKAIFSSEYIIQSIKTFYINNIDLPLILYGSKGMGKTTCIFGLLGYIPCYLPDLSYENKINNIKYFKTLDNEFSKLIYYENIYYLNLKVLHNNTDILNYLQYIYIISLIITRSTPDEVVDGDAGAGQLLEVDSYSRVRHAQDVAGSARLLRRLAILLWYRMAAANKLPP